MSLKDLLVKEADVTEEQIKTAVKLYVRYADTGKILLNENFRKLKVDDQIIVYLIAKLGWKFLGKSIDPTATNEELEKATGAPGGTIRPRVKFLRDNGLIITSKGRHKASDRAVSFTAEKEGR